MNPALWYHQLGAAYVAAQVYFHFNQVGVISYLNEKGPATVEDISSALNLDKKLLGELLKFVGGVDVIIEEVDGRYGFSEFGLKVVKRYSRVDGDGIRFNFHDVRVGAYGELWANLGDILTKKRTYGIDLKRDGRFAETALYNLSVGFVASLKEAFSKLQPTTVLEIGANTGILEKLQDELKNADLFCLDRSKKALEIAEERMIQVQNSRPVKWVHTDIFNAQIWLKQIPGGEKTCVFSVHFHEIIAQGPEKFCILMKELREKLNGGYLLVLEQPEPRKEDRAVLGEDVWLATQALMLIHHVPNIGRILTTEAWKNEFAAAGLRFVSSKPTGYLGYELMLFQF